jgi:hypothetical protein
MTALGESMAAAAYALFALQQPLPLTQLSASAHERGFPLAFSQTPDWFAAASDSESSLLEMAPELLVLPGDGDDDSDVDVSGIDLIHVYAPELQSVEDIDEEEAPTPIIPLAVPPPPTSPDTARQLGLLRELSDLDS